MKKVERFVGAHAFLSNFHMETVTIEGISFKSVEHAYQAQKTLDYHEYEAIKRAKTPGDAKRMGRDCTLREDWEAIKLDVMEKALRAKFENGSLRAKLIATGTAVLEEGNTWGDTYWGVVRGRGSNHLGRLLMKIRKELK